ncbi:hypothetical protein X777_15855 [Ooceraea biroi]|uniref:Uncharacterized protein n=1 Tax=Ooceraea biroi TaxID=2015173 RepID=A0A026WT73_OOCBI|nr:hypothetical protein X777_15855 [Ooceraea biroi]
MHNYPIEIHNSVTPASACVRRASRGPFVYFRRYVLADLVSVIYTPCVKGQPSAPKPRSNDEMPAGLLVPISGSDNGHNRSGEGRRR